MRTIAKILLTISASGIFTAISAPANAKDDIDSFLQQRGLIRQASAGISKEIRNRAAELVVNAIGTAGVPYKYGGTSRETGFDCSGFVKTIYEEIAGISLPRTSSQQAQATKKISKDELKPGDLVFFNTTKKANSHVGIYVGNDRFVHSPRSGASIRVESIKSSYWQKRFNGARRALAELSAPSKEIEKPSIFPQVLAKNSAADLASKATDTKIAAQSVPSPSIDEDFDSTLVSYSLTPAVLQTAQLEQQNEQIIEQASKPATPQIAKKASSIKKGEGAKKLAKSSKKVTVKSKSAQVKTAKKSSTKSTAKKASAKSSKKLAAKKSNSSI